MKCGICWVLLAMMLSACQSRELTVDDAVSASGLAYSLVKMPGNERVTVQVAWPNRWVFEQDENQAVPYIASRLLLSGGTSEFSPSEVEEKFADMKSEGYLDSASDYVYGTLHYSPEHQEETLRIVNAHLKSPALDERWLKRIRGEFSGYIDEAAAKSANKGFEAMRWAVFGDQPVRAFLSVDEPGMVAKVSQADVARWVTSTITRNGARIVVSGDLDLEEAGIIVDAMFDGLPEGKFAGDETVDSDFSPKRILLHSPEAETSTLSFIGKIPPTREGSEFEDLLLVNALGIGNQSVLFDAVRTELRASYGYGAGLSAFTRENRTIVLTGQVETSKIAEAENVIMQAYTQFLKEGPDGDLQQLKEPFRKSMKETRKDTGSMAWATLLAKLDGHDTSIVLTLSEVLDAVTKVSMQQRLSSAYPRADEFIVVVSTPDEKALPDACVIISPEEAVEC